MVRIDRRQPFNQLKIGCFYTYGNSWFILPRKGEILIYYDTGYRQYEWKSILYDEKTYECSIEFLNKVYNEDFEGIEEHGDTFEVINEGVRIEPGGEIWIPMRHEYTYRFDPETQKVMREDVWKEIEEE